MSSVSAQLVFLLLASALLGGLCAWWLAQRRFDRCVADAAAERQRLQDDWGQWRQQMDHRLAAPTGPDWTPLLQRLGAVEKAVHGIRLPTPEAINLRPVIDAVASMRLPGPSAVDLQPLHARLQALESDLAVVLSHLGALETRLSNLRLPEPTAAPNLQPMMTGLLELQRAVAALRMPPAG